MNYPEGIQVILKEMGQRIEYERFISGIGKVEFARLLGINYNTYTSFLRQDRMTLPKNVLVIVKFLDSKQSFKEEWHERLRKMF